MRLACLGALSLALADPGAAAVRSASTHGFSLAFEMTLSVSPTAAYRTLVAPQSWWSDAHTYSGKASNISLDLRPGGCWCEALPGGGGIEHLRIAIVRPGSGLTLTGGLGPLLGEATSGVMTFGLKPRPGGSILTVSYRAAGFYQGGADKLAPVVDQVIGEQLVRLKAVAERGL